VDKEIRRLRRCQHKIRNLRKRRGDEMTVGERISLIIKDIGATKKKFAESLNISPGHLSDWLSKKRKSNPSLEYLSKIYELYNVNLIWLVTGNGDMFNSDRDYTSDETCQRLHVESDIAAGDPVEATGKRLDSLTVGYTLLQNVNDYFCFRVNGRSMEPDIQNDDLVIIKKDNNWNHKDNIVCAVRIDGDITLKRILHDPKRKMIILLSDNKDYQPIIVDPKNSDAFMIGCLNLVVRRVE
jgi:SOS-response transcriptional repressor LexA